MTIKTSFDRPLTPHRWVFVPTRGLRTDRAGRMKSRCLRFSCALACDGFARLSLLSGAVFFVCFFLTIFNVTYVAQLPQYDLQNGARPAIDTHRFEILV